LIHRSRIARCIVPLVALSGCGGHSDAAARQVTATVDTVNGVVTVRNADQPACPSTAEATPDLSIGAMLGDPDYEFVRVWDVEAGGDGSIYVADSGRKQVMVYDASGRFRRAIGREGDGPGEFRLPAQLGWSEGHLTVLDRSHQRLNFFTPEGDLVRDTALAGLPGLARLEWPAPGHLLLQLGPLWSSPAIPGFYGVGRIVHLRLSGDGEARTLLEWSDSAATVHLGEPGLSLVAQVPYGAQAAWDQDGRGTFYFSAGSEYRILAYDTAGVLRRDITRAHRTVPVTAAERDSVLNALTHYDRRLLAQLRIPATKPPVRALKVDDRGRVWVWTATPPDVPDQRWEVFDREGIFRFAVRVPAGLRVARVREAFLLGTTVDSLGVVRVERHVYQPPC
jgi:hypothetical protein